MFAAFGDCDPIIGIVGLRNPEDSDAVLTCPRHLAALRQLRPSEAARISRYLRARFGYMKTA